MGGPTLANPIGRNQWWPSGGWGRGLVAAFPEPVQLFLGPGEPRWGGLQEPLRDAGGEGKELAALAQVLVREEV